MDAQANYKISGPKEQFSPSKYSFCCEVFHTKYGRDLHINYFYDIRMLYTGYIFVSNP